MSAASAPSRFSRSGGPAVRALPAWVGAPVAHARAGRSPRGDSPRSRILFAAVEIVAESGAEQLSVAAIVARAHVSRKTFYEIFDGSDGCLVAAADECLAWIASAAAPAYMREGCWSERLRAALLVTLELLERERNVAALAVDYLVGPALNGHASRAGALATMRRVLEEGCPAPEGEHRPPPLSAELVVGAALSVVHARLHEEQCLVDLVDPIMSMAVMLYLGPSGAARELDGTPPRALEASCELPGEESWQQLGIRMTHRTAATLSVIAERPGLSNIEIGARAGMKDGGQVSRLLSRLSRLGLIENTDETKGTGATNSWQLTGKGRNVELAIRRWSATEGENGNGDRPGTSSQRASRRPQRPRESNQGA